MKVKQTHRLIVGVGFMAAAIGRVVQTEVWKSDKSILVVRSLHLCLVREKPVFYRVGNLYCAIFG